MALIDGAEAIVGDLPRAAVTTVEVPLEAGEAIGTGVHRASALLRVQDNLREALAADDDTVILIGGDCSVAVPAVEHVAGDDLAVVWFDAHPDLHMPETSPSGAFSGMAVRAILGEGADGLVSGRALRPGNLVLAGARSLDDAEAALIEDLPLTVISAAALTGPEALVQALAATGAKRVYLHIDLDVLDPATVTGVAEPVPFGLTPAQLVAAINAARAALPLAGASLSGFAPSSPAAAVEDLGTILRIIGALA